ncbi:circadian clock protein KaiC [Chitinispirillum alkaliphilum]|nr:circadian clock protein KaiC [Chitinispirillum alkaliphilum]
MSKAKDFQQPNPQKLTLAKAPSGIKGFDEITNGGLPRGRPCLIAGKAGSGKTLLGMEFLARGATQFKEPGVLMTFEERPEDLIKNFASLGFYLDHLIEKKMLAIDYVQVERGEIEETGEYNLDGLFVRLELAISSVNAKRVVLDTIEALFSGLKDEAILRAELRRLFYWLKEKGVTTVITGERGISSITRHGLEEYVADFVLLLDHTVNERIATRRMRVVKYRGSSHGTDEYPFLIDNDGISVLPVTSLSLDHTVSNKRISSGVKRLDEMLGGKGFYKGSSVLVSGTSGTGKSTLGASFADSVCRRGEKLLYFAFEEAPSQIIRNMKSIGIDLQGHIDSGLLRIDAFRPTAWGLELHLASMHKSIVNFKPENIIIDPISNLTAVGTMNEVRSMLIRLIDFIKSLRITALFTDLISGGEFHEATDVGVSSLMDTWLLLRSIEHNGERNRGIYVLKARGIDHSNQIREFLLTSEGIDIIDAYSGPQGVLTGTARVVQEAKDRSEQALRKEDIARLQRELEKKEKQLNNQIDLLRSEFDSERSELLKEINQRSIREDVILKERENLSKIRTAEKKQADKKPALTRG